MHTGCISLEAWLSSALALRPPSLEKRYSIPLTEHVAYRTIDIGFFFLVINKRKP